MNKQFFFAPKLPVLNINIVSGKILRVPTYCFTGHLGENKLPILDNWEYKKVRPVQKNTDGARKQAQAWTPKWWALVFRSKWAQERPDRITGNQATAMGAAETRKSASRAAIATSGPFWSCRCLETNVDNVFISGTCFCRSEPGARAVLFKAAPAPAASFRQAKKKLNEEQCYGQCCGAGPILTGFE